MASLEEDISLPGEGNNGAFLSHNGTLLPLNNSSFDFCSNSVITFIAMQLPFLSKLLWYVCYGEEEK